MTTPVALDTTHGRIIVELFTERAPASSRNFLRHVDEGLYEQATFYRAVQPDNDERSPRISVLQGGIDLTCRHPPLAPIVHEATNVTGLSHTAGAVSMVRWEPGSAASEFFIVVADAPEMDFGGSRNPDGQGFAVFGRVSHGMDVVRRVHSLPTGTTSEISFMKNQAILEPVSMRMVRI
jgi:peptidyl-prolyl cis-trans isomerase A (cyclophilin A)